MNLRNNRIKQIVSFLFAFALIISFVTPSISFAQANNDSKYSVKVRIEGKDSTFVKPIVVNFDSLDLDKYPRIKQPEAGYDSLKPIHGILRALETVGIDPNDKKKLGMNEEYIFITMINGLEGNWSYRVDNKYADSGMTDYTIKSGQEVVMYYQENWEDSIYTWFDKEEITLEQDKAIELKLNGHIGYDDSVASIGIEDAVILVNDKEYKQDGKLVKTDSNGKASLSFKEAGSYHISASKKNTKGEETLSRPFAEVKVEVSTGVGETTIKSIEAVKDLRVEFGTNEDRALSLLPKTTNIVDSTGKKHSVNLKWSLENYSGNQAGIYSARASFNLPEGVKQANPEIKLELTTRITVLEKEVIVVNKDLDQAINSTVSYYQNNNPGAPAGDWEAYVGMWASGNSLTKEYDWENVDPGLEEDTGTNNTLTYAYSLLAQGKDPSNIWGGRNLFAELAGQQRDNGVFTNIGKHTFSIMLLDAGAKMGADVGSWNDTNRQRAIDQLLKMQNEDGSFESFSHLDHTGFAIMALSQYKDQEKVDETIKKALDFLKSKQTNTGGFDYNKGFDKGENSNSISIIIQALVALGEDVTDPKGAWAKNGNTPLDALMKYKNDDGSFLWKLNTNITGPATKQALVALVDVKNGKSSWIRLGDEIYLSSVGEKDLEDLKALINKLPTIDKISLDNKVEVTGAYNKYIGLPAEYKLRVTNSAILLQAQEKIEKLEVEIKEINDGIWDLPGKPEDISLKDKEKVLGLLQKYNALSDNDKKYITYYNELEAAKIQIDKLEKEQGSIVPDGENNKPGNNSSGNTNKPGNDSGANNNSQSSPKTGDNGILTPIVLLLISGTVIAFLSKKRRLS